MTFPSTRGSNLLFVSALGPALWLLLAPGAGARAAESDDDESGEADATLARAPAAALPDVPFGFYRDRQGRVMQVSFDLQRRAWLGVAYAPRRRPTGTIEIAPAAFDFGLAWDAVSTDGRTRQRMRLLDGQVQLHPFALDVTGFRFDLSHRYESPLVRVTTFFGEPERHDLFLNVGLFVEGLHFDSTPRGVAGEQQLTLGTVQGTLDLWQSADLRSYVRLRAGPGVEMRTGPWGETARFVGFAPATTLEGNLMLGRNTLQQLTFAVQGDLLRSVSLHARALPGDWAVSAHAAYEAVVVAINDQPVSLRLAFDAGVRDGTVVLADNVQPLSGSCCGWDWKATAGFRMSFFSPPVIPLARR